MYCELDSSIISEGFPTWAISSCIMVLKRKVTSDFFWIMIKLFLFMGSPALYVEILVQHITQYDKNEKIVQWKAWKKGQSYVII